MQDERSSAGAVERPDLTLPKAKTASDQVDGCDAFR